MPSIVWLDLAAERVRAWAATTGDFAPVALDGQHLDLPLAVGLDRRQPTVGRAAEHLRFSSPPAFCTGFLPSLGSGRRWAWGRHDVDAEMALRLVLHRVKDAVGAATKWFLTLPTYLSPEQTLLIRRACQGLGWKLVAQARRGHAFGLAQYVEQPWTHAAVTAEWDDHALVATLLRPVDGRLHYLGRMVVEGASRAMWRRQLLHALSRVAITRLRRDPRDFPDAEPALHEQVESLLVNGATGTVTLPLPTGVHRLQLDTTMFHSALQPLSQLTVRCLLSVLGQTIRPAGSGYLFLPAELLHAPGMSGQVYAQTEAGVTVRRMVATPAPAMLALLRALDADGLGITPDALPLVTSGHAGSTEEILPFPELAEDEPPAEVKFRLPSR